MKSFKELILALSISLNLLFVMTATIFAALDWNLKTFADVGTAVGGTIGAVVGSITLYLVYKTFNEQRDALIEQKRANFLQNSTGIAFFKSIAWNGKFISTYHTFS